MSDPKDSYAVRRGVTRSVVVLLILGFLALIGVGASSTFFAQRSQVFNGWVEHSLQVRSANRQILQLVLDAETGQRGYLLTHDKNFLDVYQPAADAVAARLDALQKLVSDNPDQAARVRELRDAVGARLATLRYNLKLAQSGEVVAAIRQVRLGLGRLQMQRVRAASASVDAEEVKLLADREVQVATANRLNLLVNGVGLALVAALALVSLALILRYVAEIQRARSELDALNQGLETIVAARTEELSTANDEIQRFAYIVSHDLRSPLVNVMGYTAELEAAGAAFARQVERLEAEAPALVDAEAAKAVREDVPEAVGFIRTSTAKMDRLIKAILQLSRDGRRVLSAERLDMTALLRAIRDSLSHQLLEADAELVVRPLPPLYGDRLAIEQIFSNLLDNAVKFLVAGKPGMILVEGAEDPVWVTYRIADNGRGIDPKDRERVFELFRRAGTQDRPGDGLGLAFVRNSVRRLGGSIELDSALGQGSTFTLKFPKGRSRTVETSE